MTISSARTAKAIVSPEKQKKIKELAGEFANLKENLDRAINVEMLKELRNAGQCNNVTSEPELV
jgi:hypothetical protein